MSAEAIQAKMAETLDYLGTLESLKENCAERMKSDKVYRGAVLYYLYMAADSYVALAEMVIKLKNLRLPQSCSEAIDILGENEIIPHGFAYDFARIAGFRNFLAHDYEKVVYEDICEIMLKRLDDVKQGTIRPISHGQLNKDEPGEWLRNPARKRGYRYARG